ncbi:MAG: GMC oxidoreductase, partial [Actinomycetota bacterium]
GAPHGVDDLAHLVRPGVSDPVAAAGDPLGEDPNRCGADSHGRIHGTTNVRVNDASLLPTAPGVNPQATVMAIAIRNVRRFIEETCVD